MLKIIKGHQVKSVTQAEQKIQKLLGTNEANWKDVAKIAIEVRERELYKDKYKSFTAWVNAIAKKCDRQPSLIWRYIKAGKIYLESIESDNIDEIDEAEAAPEVLVNLEKVQRHAPPEIFNDLKDKVLAGSVTVNESREVEQQYRPERKPKIIPELPSIEIDAQLPSVEINPQLPSVEIDTQTATIELGSASKEHQITGGLDKLKAELTPNTRMADRISKNLSITLADWSSRCAGMRYPPKFFQAHTEVRVSHQKKRLRLDLVGVVRWSFKKPKDIFGVEIKSSLSDFESDRKWENYLNFCDYFCFAIPRKDMELWEAIEDRTDSGVGILAIDFDSEPQAGEVHKVEILRKPKRLAGSSKSIIYETLYERLAGWSGKLEQLQAQQIDELISSKKEQEAETKRRKEYRIEIKNTEPDSSKIAVYSPYDSTGERQRICKSISGYSFNGYDKSWHFPKDAIAQVLEAFPEHEYYWQPELKDLLVQHRQQQKEEEERQQRELELALRREKVERERYAVVVKQVTPKIDKPLANGWELRNYQKEGVNWLIHRQKGGVYHGGILADDMGLGKTIEALTAAKLLRSQRDNTCHVFVICPVSLIENWQREAERVGVKIEIFSNHYRKIPQPVSSKYIVIADEAHYFQNPKSARTKKIKELVEDENCIASWLLTGTPIKNGSPINLFPLLEMCHHKLAEDKSHYIDRYCAPVRRDFGKKSFWDITGAAHLDELSAETKDVILRRTKKECLKELPDKMRLYKAVELESKEKKAYSKKFKELLADYHRRVKAGEVDGAAEALVTLNYMRKLNSEYKVPGAIALVEELLEQGQQVVVFTEFVESAKALYKEFRQISELLTGDTKDRQGAVDRFQDSESKLFVGTTKAGGVGITLTAASNVILVDRPWTPGDAEQAEDRCYRLGQQNAVFVNWLQLGVVDESIDNLLAEKQRNIDLVLAGKNEAQIKTKAPKEFAEELLGNL